MADRQLNHSPDCTCGHIDCPSTLRERFEFTVDRGYYVGETFHAHVLNGRTSIEDAEGTQLIIVQGEHDATVCGALIQAYEQGKTDGKSVGRIELQFELRRMLGAAGM